MDQILISEYWGKYSTRQQNVMVVCVMERLGNSGGGRQRYHLLGDRDVKIANIHWCIRIDTKIGVLAHKLLH